MARTNITAQALANSGLNLTDATYSTLGTGANNGVTFDYDASEVVVLKNPTGGAAVFTFKVPTPANYSAKGITVPDVTVTVAASKTWVYPLSPIFKQSDDKVYLDCDVAGQVLIVDL